MRIGKTSNKNHFEAVTIFPDFFSTKKLILFACHFQRKKAIAPGKVSNGKKFMIDFSSVKKIEKIWIFHEVTIDLRQNSAVMQTSNSEN